METIWDHNPTQAEIEAMGIIFTDKVEYLLNESEDGALLDLTRLYHLRNQPRKAEEYYKQINQDYAPKKYASMSDLMDFDSL